MTEGLTPGNGVSGDADIISMIQGFTGGKGSNGVPAQPQAEGTAPNADPASQGLGANTQETAADVANNIASQQTPAVGDNRPANNLKGEFDRKYGNLQQENSQLQSQMMAMQQQLVQQQQQFSSIMDHLSKQTELQNSRWEQANRPAPVDPFAGLNMDDPDHMIHAANIRSDLAVKEANALREEMNKWRQQQQQQQQQQQLDYQRQQYAQSATNMLNAAAEQALGASHLNNAPDQAKAQLRQMLFDVGVTALTERDGDLNRIGEVAEYLGSYINALTSLVPAQQATPTQQVPPTQPLTGSARHSVSTSLQSNSNQPVLTKEQRDKAIMDTIRGWSAKL